MDKQVSEGADIRPGLNLAKKRHDFKKSAKERWIQKQLEAISKFDQIVNSSMDGLWVADETGKILKVNHMGLGNADFFSKEEVVNQNVRELMDKGLFDRSVILEVIRTHKPHMVIHKLQDGRQLLRIANPVFYKDKELGLVIVHERDMTDLYLLRSDLNESRSLDAELSLELEQQKVRKELLAKANVRSEKMYKVLDKAIRISQVDSTVLIKGESGVGKGYFANLIHQASVRKNQPFIRLDCGSIPEQLIEAELFGYEGGAFTGALSTGKPGYFELADGGTLFLDEIGELPLHIQVKLLRFLEDNQLVRVGGTRVKRINTRVLAATNRSLSRMVAEKLFRKDLYYRLNVIPLRIPPLRERVADIPALIYHFLNYFNKKYSKNKAIFPKAIECLCSYRFGGNVRELSNLMEELIVLHPGEKIDWDDLPAYVKGDSAQSGVQPSPDKWNLQEMVANTERRHIKLALKTFGSQRKAAVPLGINHSTLARKIKKLGLSSRDG